MSTYDYRGIGGSRPESMRGFQANWLDWGGKDFEGVLRFSGTCYKGHDIMVPSHSVGGFLVGMAPSKQLIKRVFTMGSQFAYWRDYAKHKRFAMFLRWHRHADPDSNLWLLPGQAPGVAGRHAEWRGS